MNRLHHVANTLGSNIYEASLYGHEVVLLNYGDKNGLDDWIKFNWNFLLPYVNSGNFNYYHTTEPEYFSASHAKNIAYKVASGDILCNMDADNYIVDGFCKYVTDSFEQNENIAIISYAKDPFGNDGTCGKIAVKKEAFYSVNGYDEYLPEGWSYDDVNFQERCRAHNGLDLIICPMYFNKVIPHSDEERTANFRRKDFWQTALESKEKTNLAHSQKQFVANLNSEWGKASLLKNFDTVVLV